jgi:hypothetical protein
MNAAEERGLSAGGLKEVARDVASAFEGSLSGDDKDKSADRGSAKQDSIGKHSSGSGRSETVGTTGQASNAAGGRPSTQKGRPDNR